MKLSMRWLREHANPRVTDAQLADRLTRVGLECSVIAPPVALDGVVVGLIESIAPHPQAERLRVCTVDAGTRARLTIVCGAANARAGMKAPLATLGAKLPDGTVIARASLRGVDSEGMLCSAKELGLAEKSEGLLELDAAAVPGTPIGAHLGLDDTTLELELTPNRGDCLSVLGLSREIGAVYGIATKPVAGKAVKPTDRRALAVKIEAKSDCSGYAGRAVLGIDPAARTPDWMRERLRRSGIRAISPVVDVTNYVMLELGQPMHGFDLAQLGGTIVVRRAKAGEALTLLNEQSVTLTADDLLIADQQRPLALAGVMGGAGSAVGPQTTDIFFESACFAPERVAATGRRLKIASDALYRFERGVDPTLQRRALERATELLIAIAGGRAGPVVQAGKEPRRVPVRLRRERMDSLLGYAIPAAQVEGSLKRLGLAVKRSGKSGWTAVPPGHRHDLRLEVDLIEEAARLHGYDRIPTRAYAPELAPAPVPERRPLDQARSRMVARGYQEAITYAFVDAGLQAKLAPDATAIPLDNPIADTLAHMRTTLWAGLIPAWRHNAQRQRARVKLFEIGVTFAPGAGSGAPAPVETERLAAILAGPAAPEQWGVPARPADFFDLKGDVEALCAGIPGLGFVAAGHPALHPGQTARIQRDGRAVGWVGRLHPQLTRALDLPEAPLLLELETSALAHQALPEAPVLGEFPQSRRDLAVLAPENLAAGRILEIVRSAAGPLLRHSGVFDVYQGAGLPNGFKSVALGLIFQDYSRTLTDLEVDSAMQAVVQRLQGESGVTIRGDRSGGVDQGGAGRSPV